MAKGGGSNKTLFEPGAPKKTRQGRSARTLLSATSRNGRKKKYRGQGKWRNYSLSLKIKKNLWFRRWPINLKLQI